MSEGRARTILHVDMDSFYASVELVLDPSLVGKPVIVGASGARGVVASCSYEARAYGVHSAMPSLRARRLCPDAVFIDGHYDRYAEYSGRFHEVFRCFTPLVEGISLDEAFLDVTGSSRLFGDGATIAAAIRARIHDELSLPCAVGVAANKFVAKLASKAAKPMPSRSGPVGGAGVVVVEPGTELAFLHPLPVRAIWGLGPATEKRLHRFGVTKVADLAALPLATLVGALGPAQGRHLHDLAWARDDRPVVPDVAPKSVSHEETYARDLHTYEALGAEAVRLGDAVATRATRAGLVGRTITIKVRFHDFRTITRSHTIDDPTAAGPVIAAVARELLTLVDPGIGVRLFGVALSSLSAPSDEQLVLDLGTDGDEGDRDADWADAARAVEEVRRRFGDDAVGPASLVGDGAGLRLKRLGDTHWGPVRSPEGPVRSPEGPVRSPEGPGGSPEGGRV